MKNSLFKSYFSLAFAMIIVGSSVVVGKVLTIQMPVFLAGGLSLFVASVLFLLLLLKKEGRFLQVSKRDFLFLGLQAFVGIFLYRILLLYGLRFIGSAESGIITSTGPAVMAILAFIFLKEKLHVTKVIGICLSVIGMFTLYIFQLNHEDIVSVSLLGGLLIFGTVVAENFFSIFAKPLSKKATPLLIASYVTFFSFFMFLPFAVYESLSFHFSNITAETWIAVGYYGVFVTVVSFLLWFRGLAKVDASTAGVFMSLVPVSSVLLSYIVLSESFVWSHLVGGLFAIAGILFITKSKSEVPLVDLDTSA